MQESPAATLGPAMLARPVHSSDALTMFGLALALAQAVSQPLSAIATDTASLCRMGAEAGAAQPARVCASLERLRAASGAACDTVLQAVGLLRATNEWARLDLGVLIRDVAMRIATSSLGGYLDFTIDLPPDLPLVSVNRAQIERLLWEVIRNAAETGGGGRVRRIRIGVTAAPEELTVAIEDDGPGCADPERAFALFETSKPGHAGIGLSIARAFATANGGQLAARPAAGGGLGVFLTLPRSEGRAGSPSAGHSQAPSLSQ